MAILKRKQFSEVASAVPRRGVQLVDSVVDVETSMASYYKLRQISLCPKIPYTVAIIWSPVESPRLKAWPHFAASAVSKFACAVPRISAAIDAVLVTGYCTLATCSVRESSKIANRLANVVKVEALVMSIEACINC